MPSKGPTTSMVRRQSSRSNNREALLTLNVFNRHSLSDGEKQEYINAELCLMRLPPKAGLKSCNSVFDELQAGHQVSIFHLAPH